MTSTYGPLTGQIGTWNGDKGMDIAPEPDGTEHNPYYETITYTAIGRCRKCRGTAPHGFALCPGREAQIKR